MKSLIFALVNFPADAAVLSGTSELHPAARAFELVIDGGPAQKLFETLKAEPRRVSSSDGDWLNRQANGILCGQNLRARSFSCSLTIDEGGVQK